MDENRIARMKNGIGFIAALDQSGGSTPETLRRYGVNEKLYSNESEMYDLVHEMRTRIITSTVFNSQSILGVILFRETMKRQLCGVNIAEYLEKKNILTFLKIDNGMCDVRDSVCLMKPIENFEEMLNEACWNNMFGTKMRSVIKGADRKGIRAVVEQQFDVAERVAKFGLIPIIEPEVDISIDDKEETERILREELDRGFRMMDKNKKVILKLSLPSKENFYRELLEVPQVIRIMALSGGYTQDQANEALSKNQGVIASFSRALLEGLNVKQSNKEFDKILGQSIRNIALASST